MQQNINVAKGSDLLRSY